MEKAMTAQVIPIVVDEFGNIAPAPTAPAVEDVAMQEVLKTGLEALPEESETSASGWSAEKTKRVALRVVSLASAVGAGFAVRAAVAAAAPGVAIPVAVALGVLAVASHFYANSIVDYSNRAELKAAQTEAAHLPLDKLVRKHGWDNIFGYGIVPPDALYTKFTTYAADATIANIIDMHDAAAASWEKARWKFPPYHYALPNASFWRDKFFREIEPKSGVQFVEGYNIAALERHGLIGPDVATELMSLSRDYFREKEVYRIDVARITAQKHQEIDSLHRECEKQLAEIRRAYESSPEARAEARILEQYNVRLATLRGEHFNRLAARARGAEPLNNGEPQPLAADGIRQAEAELAQAEGVLNREREELIAQARELQRLREQELDRALKTIRERFSDRIRFAEMAAGVAIGLAAARFHEKIGEINSRYTTIKTRIII